METLRISTDNLLKNYAEERYLLEEQKVSDAAAEKLCVLNQAPSYQLPYGNSFISVHVFQGKGIALTGRAVQTQLFQIKINLIFGEEARFDRDINGFFITTTLSDFEIKFYRKRITYHDTSDM